MTIVKPWHMTTLYSRELATLFLNLYPDKKTIKIIHWTKTTLFPDTWEPYNLTDDNQPYTINPTPGQRTNLYTHRCQHYILTDDKIYTLTDKNPNLWQFKTLYPDRWPHYTLKNDNQPYTLTDNIPISWQMTTLYPDRWQPYTLTDDNQPYTLRDDNHLPWYLTTLYPWEMTTL